MLRRISYNFVIAIDAIGQNKLRAMLTSLGIIFGVASVIAMLAIGQGAQLEILEQMEILGVNNIIIKPTIEQQDGEIDEEEEDAEGEEEGGGSEKRKRYTPGLTMQDVYSLAALPNVSAVSPEVEITTLAVRSGRKRTTKLIGVNNSYFMSQGFELMEGRLFAPDHFRYSRPVCIIGQDIKTRFFPTEEPLGKTIKCGDLWLTIIGVLKGRNISKDTRSELRSLGIRNYDLDIYAPLNTVLLRYENRSAFSPDEVREAERNQNRGRLDLDGKNYHQVDKLVLQVSDTRFMNSLAEVSNRMLNRRHNKVVDFEITVPEVLLEQKRRTTSIFNIVLGAIASISLIVGGIGIMNIMLASVMERIKEIGLRLSLGATQRDIILQFMSEAVAISLSGGLIGIILGVLISVFIEKIADIQTVISGWSVLLSFVVAVTVGLIFGIYPAKQAAKQDPVVSLRSN